MSSLFGNNNNQGGGLFGNNKTQAGGGLFGNTSNNQAGGGLFGNTSNNQAGSGLFGNTGNNQAGSGLFGNTSNNQAGGGLFGNTGNNQAGGGLFGNTGNNQTGGGLFGNTGNNQTGGGLFGNTSNNNQGGGLFGNSNTQGNSLFGNNNQGGGLFGNNNSNNKQGGLFGNNNINANQNQNQQIPNSEFYTTVTPVIALNRNNDIKDVQLYKLPPQFQDAVLKLKLNLKNQEIKLDELQRYSQRLIELIDQSNKSVEKLSEFNSFINQKLNKYELLVNQIKDNFNFISESFEEEQANIQLMEQDLGYKIEIPSKFLINYSQNLYKRTTMFQQRLNDVITLIKLYSSQSNNNDFNFDCDIMESTIAEFIKIVRYLLEMNEKQERMVNEMYQVIVRFAGNHGEDPDTVINNIKQYCIESNSI